MKKFDLLRVSKFCLLIFFVMALFISTKEASAQSTASIKGKVTDSKGVVLPGVTVKLEGTATQSQATDANGNYSFTSLRAGNYTLTYTFLGFAPFTNRVTLAAGQASVTDATLTEETNNLDEVVVVGYGTQKKTSVTAAVSSIQGDAISKLPVTSLNNSLGGRVTGLVVRQTSGEPGRDDANIYIRGVSTLGSTAPLLIVDGIPGRAFASLDPESIETVSVLKDAAAVAPYGVAGANGVILVTTKRGKEGLPTLTFNSSYGIQNPTVLPEMPTGYEFAFMLNAAAKNDWVNSKSTAPFVPPYTDAELQKFKDGSDPDRYPSTNAMDLIERNTPLLNTSIQLSGGADKVKYFASLGYMFQAGIFTITDVNRYNLSFNLDAQATKTTTLSLGLSGRDQVNEYSPITTSRLFELIKYALPNLPLFYSNGMSGSKAYIDIYNSGRATNKTTQIFGQLSLDQKLPFVPGLSAKGTVGFDPRYSFDKTWRVPVYLAAITNVNTTPYTITQALYEQALPSLSQTATVAKQLTYQASLSYNRTFGKHQVGALALFEDKANQQYNITAARTNYNLYVDELSSGSSTPTDASNSGGSSRARQMGVVYRSTYAYNDKYLLELSGRYDGHYYFAPGKRFGFFPSASVGWRISQENFFKQALPWVDNFKIKASYGEVGALAGSAFQYLSTYQINGNAYVFGNNAVQSVSERNEPNVNITWERAKKTDVGFESSFWRGLLTLEADYFHELRSNMLAAPDVTVPAEYGIGLSQVNAGRMKNAGMELTLGSRYRFTRNLQASFKASATYAKNTALQIFESAATYNNPNRRQTGRDIGTQFGYHALGFFLPSDFDSSGKLLAGIPTPPNNAKVYPGELRYQDTNGDGKLDVNDYVPIGKPAIPQLIYGLNPGLSYKGLTVDLLFQGTGARNFQMGSYGIFPFAAGRGANKNNLDFWTPENLNAKFPAITGAPSANTLETSDWWMFDAKYLRLKNALISYSLPKSITQRLKFQKVALNVSAQNLKTWTKMEYFDVEGSSSTGGYPTQSVVSFGLNVTF
jgi:TonB-linked SusC/RagA family outer membrane protein